MFVVVVNEFSVFSGGGRKKEEEPLPEAKVNWD